jgi:uncharacterized protein
MPVMMNFIYKTRSYNVSFSPANNGDSILVITNQDGSQLTIRKGELRAIRKDRQGKVEEIDLQKMQHQEFYNGLIEEAEKVIEREYQSKADSFFSEIEVEYEEQIQDFDKTLNIVVIGNVSSGKSSLINAFLMRTRRDMIAKVGVTAGVTTTLNILRLDERVRLIDSPGLGDIRTENSQVTQEFLSNIDVGILVVTGVADASQKSYFDDLKESCGAVFLVLNKIDEWDRFKPQALTDVMNQWKESLKVSKIYPVCAFGYDPQLANNTPLDIRGLTELREDVETFLESQEKKLLLARHMSEKRSYALGIIATAVISVGVQAALPGKAVLITATQVVAISSLYYLYTGKILSKGAALGILPVFAGQSVATNVFLFFTSFIPPTGIVEIAAAITAISVTTAMLAAVNFVLSSGAELTEKDILKSKFTEYREQVRVKLKKLALTDIKRVDSLNFKDIINELI